MARKPRKVRTLKVAERRAEVLEVMRQEAWSLPVAKRLAAHYGVNQSTIYRDRTALLEELADEQREGRAAVRAELLLTLKRQRDKADRDGDHTVVLRSLTFEAKLRGVDEPEPVTVEPAVVPVDGLERLRYLYRDVHALRRQCEGAGKATAAMQAMKQEHDLLAQIAEEEERRAAADRANRPADVLVNELVSEIRDLPDMLRARVLAQLGE